MDQARKYLAEFLGTFIMVFFAVTANSSGPIAGALVGLGQVAAVNGLGVTLAIYTTADISGAHLNPAVTLVFAVWHSFPWSNVAGYFVAQFAGAICAAGLNYGLYSSTIARFEAMSGIVRGAAGIGKECIDLWTVLSKSRCFPIPVESSPEHIASLQSFVSPGLAFLTEMVGTAILLFVILSLIDKKNTSISPHIVPVLIGCTVTSLISVLAPITQAGFNPVRDFAPRLVALAVGWGQIAIPGPRNGFWVYILGPIVGAQLGAALHYVLYKATSVSLRYPP
ncbi:aquaporin-like protein, partial [Rhizoclosmatium globosum]